MLAKTKPCLTNGSEVPEKNEKKKVEMRIRSRESNYSFAASTNINWCSQRKLQVMLWRTSLSKLQDEQSTYWNRSIRAGVCAYTICAIACTATVVHRRLRVLGYANWRSLASLSNLHPNPWADRGRSPLRIQSIVAGNEHIMVGVNIRLRGLAQWGDGVSTLCANKSIHSSMGEFCCLAASGPICMWNMVEPWPILPALQRAVAAPLPDVTGNLEKNQLLGNSRCDLSVCRVNTVLLVAIRSTRRRALGVWTNKSWCGRIWLCGLTMCDAELSTPSFQVSLCSSVLVSPLIGQETLSSHLSLFINGYITRT